MPNRDAAFVFILGTYATISGNVAVLVARRRLPVSQQFLIELRLLTEQDVAEKPGYYPL